MAKRKSDFELPTLDDLFTSQAERDEAKLPRIRNIAIALIDPFPNHPYKVKDDESMEQLVESIEKRGVITPAVVRLKEDGRYELVSGHRRKRACEILGLTEIRCEVKELTIEEATIMMVESNLQRPHILPSEKAYAYKMRLDAMNRQGKRSDLTCAPLEHKLRGLKSVEIISEETSESRAQIQRYIRLTNLIPELLDMVDNSVLKEKGKLQMALRPAVEISYLDEEAQKQLADQIEYNVCTPTHAQAIQLRKLFEEGELTEEMMDEIISEEKPNQKERIVLRGERIRKLIPKEVPLSKTEDYIARALEFYSRYRMKNREERDAR